MLYSVLLWGNKTQVFYCWETTTEKQKKFFTDIKVASYRHPHSLLYLSSFSRAENNAWLFGIVTAVALGRTYPPPRGARRALPSWAASCPPGRPRSPARCGSAAAADTPRGPRRRLRGGASCGDTNGSTAVAKQWQYFSFPKNRKRQDLVISLFFLQNLKVVTRGKLYELVILAASEIS